MGFLGYPVSQAELLSNSATSAADNRMQHGYIQALESAFGRVTVISSVRSADYPGTSCTDGRITWSQPPVTRSRAGAIVKAWHLYRELALWAASAGEDRKVLVYYNTFFLYALLGTLLRRRHGALVVPIAITLPYITPDAAPTLSTRLQARLSARLIRHSDGLVAITPFLGGHIAPQVPTCVIRGAVPDELTSLSPRAPERSERPARVVFAGNLTARYHLLEAVEAMAQLPPGRFELHLYGRGALEEELRCIASRNHAVVVHGAIPSDEVPEVLRGADVLLAVLKTDDALALYSFPSKLFECLASGVPTVTSDLPTLDDEMRQHLYIVGEVTPAAMADAIHAALRLSPEERTRRADQQQACLRETATWSAVGSRLRSFFALLETR